MSEDAGEQLRRFARAVYGGCSGFVEVSYFMGRAKKTTAIPIDEFLNDPSPILEVAESGYDVYLGCVTLSEVPPQGKRGKFEQRLDVPGAWLDLDLAIDGHHKVRNNGLRHLASVDEAQELLSSAGLPEPTALLHSGGGLYAWWLFSEPLVLREDAVDQTTAVALSEALHQHVSLHAEKMGAGVDYVSDMVRVLRPPGTLNWKRGAIAPPTVRLLYLDEDLRVSPEDFAQVLEDVVPHRPVVQTTDGSRSTRSETDGPALPDAAKAASWEELLFPLGWTYGAPVSGGTSFLRPGYSGDTGAKPGDGYGGSSAGSDDAKSAVVYADGPEVLVVFSDACGLPAGSGQKLTKFRVIAHLWFNGNMGACARDIGNAAQAFGAGLIEPVEGSNKLRSIWPESVLKAAGELVGAGMSGRWASKGPWSVRTMSGGIVTVMAQ